jgi:hypothetical protein
MFRRRSSAKKNASVERSGHWAPGSQDLGAFDKAARVACDAPQCPLHRLDMFMVLLLHNPAAFPNDLGHLGTLFPSHFASS